MQDAIFQRWAPNLIYRCVSIVTGPHPKFADKLPMAAEVSRTPFPDDGAVNGLHIVAAISRPTSLPIL